MPYIRRQPPKASGLTGLAIDVPCCTGHGLHPLLPHLPIVESLQVLQTDVLTGERLSESIPRGSLLPVAKR